MKHTNSVFQGFALAVLATIIWSGNFVVARGIINDISPIGLSFFRWLTACIVLLPFCFKGINGFIQIIRNHFWYFFWTAFTGVTLFNTLVYVAGHHSPAINLALIGTTSSPIISIILARLFLKEKLGTRKFVGMIICIAGILFLLSGGSVNKLLSFRFSEGDLWVLAAGASFAVYNIFVRKRPVIMKGTDFLFITFALGTLILLPFFVIESFYIEPISWSPGLIGIFIYLGLGASVIAFLCWNVAISRLGAGKTALFGNLIPVFSVVEAMLILKEKISIFHLIGGLIVIGGLILANLPERQIKSSIHDD